MKKSRSSLFYKIFADACQQSRMLWSLRYFVEFSKSGQTKLKFSPIPALQLFWWGRCYDILFEIPSLYCIPSSTPLNVQNGSSHFFYAPQEEVHSIRGGGANTTYNLGSFFSDGSYIYSAHLTSDINLLPSTLQALAGALLILLPLKTTFSSRISSSSPLNGSYYLAFVLLSDNKVPENLSFSYWPEYYSSTLLSRAAAEINEYGAAFKLVEGRALPFINKCFDAEARWIYANTVVGANFSSGCSGKSSVQALPIEILPSKFLLPPIMEPYRRSVPGGFVGTAELSEIIVRDNLNYSDMALFVSYLQHFFGFKPFYLWQEQLLLHESLVTDLRVITQVSGLKNDLYGYDLSSGLSKLKAKDGTYLFQTTADDYYCLLDFDLQNFKDQISGPRVHATSGWLLNLQLKNEVGYKSPIIINSLYDNGEGYISNNKSFSINMFEALYFLQCTIRKSTGLAPGLHIVLSPFSGNEERHELFESFFLVYTDKNHPYVPINFSEFGTLYWF